MLARPRGRENQRRLSRLRCRFHNAASCVCRRGLRSCFLSCNTSPFDSGARSRRQHAARAMHVTGLEPFPFRLNRNGALSLCFDAFSSREPISTSLENALAGLFLPEGGLSCVRHLNPFRVGRGAGDVTVIPVPPLVGPGLRIALRRILPLLLTPERRHVEVVPDAAHRLVAAAVDHVGAEDALAVAEERVVTVPLIHAEV